MHKYYVCNCVILKYINLRHVIIMIIYMHGHTVYTSTLPRRIKWVKKLISEYFSFSRYGNVKVVL